MKLQGWRAVGAAFLAGALAALAMPPLYWLPLAVVGIVVFVWLWETAPGPRSALLRGWAWGIGHFAVGSYWILEAFFVPPADFALLGPPIVAGLAVRPRLLPGRLRPACRAGWSMRWPGLGGRYRRLILLAIAWTVAEWLRGHLFTGYPWNPLGHVWAFATPLLQGAALFGVYGLGTLTFLVLAAPTAGWRASLAALVAVGARRLCRPAGHDAQRCGRRRAAGCASCSPTSPQAEKWRPENRARAACQAGRNQPARRASTAWPP